MPGALAAVFHAQEAAGCPGAGAVGTPCPGPVRGQVGLAQRLGVGRVGRWRKVEPRRSAIEKGWRGKVGGEGREEKVLDAKAGLAMPALPVSE